MRSSLSSNILSLLPTLHTLFRLVSVQSRPSSGLCVRLASMQARRLESMFACPLCLSGFCAAPSFVWSPCSPIFYPAPRSHVFYPTPVHSLIRRSFVRQPQVSSGGVSSSSFSSGPSEVFFSSGSPPLPFSSSPLSRDPNLPLNIHFSASAFSRPLSSRLLQQRETVRGATFVLSLISLRPVRGHLSKPTGFVAG